MIEKPADTAIPIADLLARRWSGRAFDPTRGVTMEQITALLEAARWAPSCYGDQPWHYIVYDQKRDRSAWEQALSCLAEGNQTWAESAPLLFLAVARQRFRTNERDNRWAQYDTGSASISLCLQATSMGLMAHQMGGFDADKIADVSSLPAEVTAMAVIAVGYPLPLDSIPEQNKERELAPRNRLPLTANFYYGKWGVSWDSQSTRE